MQVIHVALGTDEHYLQHAGVMLASLFQHDQRTKFQVLLMTAGLPDASVRKLEQLVEQAGHTIRVLLINEEVVRVLPLSAHATAAVYYRLLLPQLLDHSIEKVLYLDSDIVVKDSLLPLWQTDVSKYPLAAVEDPIFNRHTTLGLSARTPYFNSGVMLINILEWRKRQVPAHSMHFLQQNPDKINAWDQDALNAVLKGDWLPLHPRWNQQTVHFEPDKHYAPIEAQLLEECMINPAIIHYTAKFKPWHEWCEHPLKGEYYRYLSLTPWRNFKYDKDSFIVRMKHRIYKLALYKNKK